MIIRASFSSARPTSPALGLSWTSAARASRPAASAWASASCSTAVPCSRSAFSGSPPSPPWRRQVAVAEHQLAAEIAREPQRLAARGAGAGRPS